jgi:hypothetical protein
LMQSVGIGELQSVSALLTEVGAHARRSIG